MMETGSRTDSMQQRFRQSFREILVHGVAGTFPMPVIVNDDNSILGDSGIQSPETRMQRGFVPTATKRIKGMGLYIGQFLQRAPAK